MFSPTTPKLTLLFQRRRRRGGLSFFDTRCIWFHPCNKPQRGGGYPIIHTHTLHVISTPLAPPYFFSSFFILRFRGYIREKGLLDDCRVICFFIFSATPLPIRFGSARLCYILLLSFLSLAPRLLCLRYCCYRYRFGRLLLRDFVTPPEASYPARVIIPAMWMGRKSVRCCWFLVYVYIYCGRTTLREASSSVFAFVLCYRGLIFYCCYWCTKIQPSECFFTSNYFFLGVCVCVCIMNGSWENLQPKQEAPKNSHSTSRESREQS